jgi:hypothetical protein
MLDILHYLFDKDATFTSAEHSESQSAIRTAIYENLYNKQYPYATNSATRSTTGDDYGDGDDYLLPPAVSNDRKPYVPPTPFNPDAENPFQGVLREAPLG